MNSKKAKELRKAVQFNPKDERQYLVKETPKINIVGGYYIARTIVNAPNSKRGLYQITKRILKSS